MSINAGTINASLILDMDQYNAHMKKAEKQADNFTRSWDKGMNKLNSIGNKLTLGITAPVMLLGKKSIQAGADFEAGMSQVQAISGATAQEMVQLEAAAKEMGRTTKFSASESAEALKYMSMAGWDTNSMLAALPGVMDLAAASGEDLGLVSDIVTDALTGFGMEASQASEFADLLASASSNSNTNVALMGETFKYVAPLFGSLNYSAEDAALAIGLMANAGIKGSQAGTTLRAAVTSMIKPTDAAAGAMDKLGISVTDANGEMLPFQDLMIQLREKFAGLTEEQKAQYAATIFGREAMSGMLAIINASEADFNKLTNATRDYNGEANRMAETMEDNLQGQITKLKSALEGLAIDGFEILVPHLQKFVEWLQKGADWVGSLTTEQQELILKMIGLAAATGPIIKLISLFGKGIGKVVSINKKWITATELTGSGIGLLGKVITMASGGPMTLVVAAIGAIVYAMYRMYKAAGDSIEPFQGFSDNISDSTAEAMEAFMDFETQMKGSLYELKTATVEGTQQAMQELVESVSGGANLLLAELDEKQNLALEGARKAYEEYGILSEEEYEKEVERINKRYDNEREGIQEQLDRVSEIKRAAHEQERELTETELKEIESIIRNMEKQSLDVLVQSQEEQTQLKEEMANQRKNISVEEASTIVKNSIEKRDKVIDAAEEEYEQALEYAEALKLDGSKESEELAERVIANAEKKRDSEIKEAEKTWLSTMKILGNKKEDILKHIDAETGEILAKNEMGRGKDLDNLIVHKGHILRETNELTIGVAGYYDEMTGKTHTETEMMVTYWKNALDQTQSNADNTMPGVAKTTEDNFHKAGQSAVKASGDLDAWNNKQVQDKSARFTMTRIFDTIGKPFSIGNNARGTEYWKGGPTWVGEQGRELLNLPRGTQIKSNQKSEKASGGSSKTEFNIDQLIVREEADVKKIAIELDNMREKKARGWARA